MPLVSSLFSITPTIRKRNGKLIAESSTRQNILWLGAYRKRVIVDPAKRIIRTSTRTWWAARSDDKFPFDLITAITYGHWQSSSTWGWSQDGGEAFHVGLKLDSGQEVPLFGFYGDRQFTNDGPLPNWMYWEEYLFDTIGTQESEGKRFVTLLSKMVNVGVQPPSLG